MKKLIFISLALALLLASCVGEGNESSVPSTSLPEESKEVSAEVSLPQESEISEESVYVPVNLFEKSAMIGDGKLQYDFNPTYASNEYSNIKTFMDTLYSSGSFTFPVDEKYVFSDNYSGRAGDYFSFVYIDLETGCSLAYNPDIIYQTCSVIKPSLAVYLLKNGVDLSEEITITSYAGGSGVLKKSDIGSSFTVEYLIEIMITESDNTAYTHLLKKYGQQEFSDYLASIGNKNTNVGAPTWYKFGLISARDLACMMQDVYAFSTQSEKGVWVLELMQKTSYNDLITSIECGIPVAHKYGEDNGIEPSLHDGAVYLGEHPYVLVILSKSDVNSDISYDKFRAITVLVNQFHCAMHGGADMFTTPEEVTGE